jgi:hypothetical protein
VAVWGAAAGGALADFAWAPRLLKIESEACETFRAGLYLLDTAQPFAYYHICLILAQGEGGVH